MSNVLTFDPMPDGLITRLKDGQRMVPVVDWTSQAGSPGVGVLIRLRDDGAAVERDDGLSLMVSWPSVAGLTATELRYVGLPDAAPFALEVIATGAIHDADFEVRYGFMRGGVRVVGARRDGAWLHVGNDDFVLLDALYAITDTIDRFRQAMDTDLESRMLWWGRIAKLLPGDAVVDDRLRALNIVVASCFELRPFVNDKGEPDFDPVVGRRETHDDQEQVFVSGLPDARQKEFARRFRSLSRVNHRYAAGGNAFVVLTPEVERALRVVRRAQTGAAEERRDFLQNVSGYLCGALDNDDDGAIDVDAVFSDDGLSERVSGVGVWVNKTLPWIQRASEPWLPPERLGLRVGSHTVFLAPNDLVDLLGRVRAAVEGGVATVHTGDGTSIAADSSTINAIEELIRQTQPVQFPKADPVSDSRPHEGDGSGDDEQVLLVIDNLENLQFRRRRRTCRPGIMEASPALRSDLLPHQQGCLVWLKRHWEAGNWGVLLADDMGLGKTLEALAFFSCLKTYAAARAALPHQPVLVVAPTGLLANWRAEHDKHLAGPGLGEPVEAHGRGLRRLRTGAMSAGNELVSDPPLPKLDIEKLKKAPWVLTTYETLRDYQHSFGRVHWRAAVFDEAQKIKNPGARVTDAALAMNIDFALLMTGTPVENRPADVWAMLDRAEPGMFGTLKEFSRSYEADVDGHSSLADLHRRLTQPQPPESDAPVLMLRRLKEDHLSGLPDKCVHRRIVEMPLRQAEEYERLVLNDRQDVSMLQTLHYLRNVSLHPAALSSAASNDLDIDRYVCESARLSETFGILESVADRGEKALLFVESREMQSFLIVALRRRFRLSEDILVVNGTVAGRTRQARVGLFQNRKGFDVMVLSPRAGGVGLTLTAANHVIHLSRWWNPAVEDQCTDRVFRIGQRRPVHVYLPLARHPRFGDYSFDLKLDSLMERKREMNRRVLAPVAASKEDVGDLYRSTMMEARGGGDVVRDVWMDGIDVDLLEPTAFEEWVLRQFAEAGYDTRRTPRSGDRGADGLAVSRGDNGSHTVIVQCKHMQPDAKCGREAVEEVLLSVRNYEFPGEARPLVVTNAAGFTASAKHQARQQGVRLVSRQELWQLRTWHG